MIRSILTMRPKPGCKEAVSRLFQRENVFEQALTVDGCLGCSMLARDGEILVTATWTNADAYRAWIAHPDRSSANDEINELLEVPLTSETVAELYEIVLAVPAWASEQ